MIACAPSRITLASLLTVVACVAFAGGARGDAASRQSMAAGEAVVRTGGSTASAVVVPAPARARFGHAELYVPTVFAPVDGTYDLVVHFHGISSLQEDNYERARLNAAVVSVNLGIASDAYADAFRAPGSFDALLAQTHRALVATGRAQGAHLGRIALTAWSAGFAAVGAILRQPGVMDRVDAVLLADGPHANYAASHKVNDAAIARWVHVAEEAMNGEKLFALTHSSIPTEGYPSTTETIGELLKLTAVEKVPTDATGPIGMRAIYESHRGDFHVAGYEGTTKKDHIDHIKAMAETLLPYLRDRWSGKAAVAER